MRIFRLFVLLLAIILVTTSDSQVSYAATPQCINLSYGLRYGSTDNSNAGQVSVLQEYLASQGFLDSEPTGYFGGLTLAAVRSLQSSTGIESTGFVGPLTRAKIRELSCGGSSVPPIQYSSQNVNPAGSGSSIYTGNINFGSSQTNPYITVAVCAPGAMFNIVTGAPCPSNPIYYNPPVVERPSSFTIITPNGGESFTQGSNMEIRWNTRQTSPNVSIELRRDSVSGSTIISSYVQNTGSVVWQIPANQPLASDYRVYVIDTTNRNINDESNGVFSIIQSPYTAKSITSFNFSSPQVTGVIDESAKTVSLTLPYGTTNRSYAPVITVTPNATISPASGVVQNFTTYKDYVVRAQNGSQQTYRVTVAVDTGSSGKSITSFTFSNSQITATVNESGKTIAINAPYGTSVSSLAPTIAISANAVVSPASGVARDFRSTQTYTVRAQDGTTQTYTTSTGFGPKSTANQIISFSIPSVANSSVNIDQNTRVINVNVPFGTVVTSLAPAVSVSANATVAPASGVPKNFTSPVDYVVTAQDGTSKRTYTVKIVPASPDTGSSITSFAFNNANSTFVINDAGTTKTVTLTVPFGTNVASLIPIIGLSAGATVTPVSGVAQSFSLSKTYTLKSQDNLSQSVYTVSVVKAAASQASAITGVTFTGVSNSSFVVDNNQKIVTVTVPNGTSRNSLTPTISVSPFATVVPASGVAKSFTDEVNGVSYKVTAQDVTASSTYKVRVIVAN